MKRLLALLLCALLPAAAHAEVTILPTLAPDVSVRVNEYAIDLSGYYADDSDGSFVEYQLPSLTEAEKARVPALLERYAGGERPRESALGRTEDVTVGVYALSPEDYQGEKAFVLLPARDLSDEELLELIDGYARLGLTFDACSLSWRCCMRGGAINATRFAAGDERERRKTLADLYTRQSLRPQKRLTALPDDDGVGLIHTRAEDYAGLQRFDFLPCRRLTDEELLEQLQDDIGETIPDVELNNRCEAQARAQLAALLGAPLSIQKFSEGIYEAEENDNFYYTSGYQTAPGEEPAVYYWVKLNVSTGQLEWADIQPVAYDALPDSDLRCDPYDEKWLRIGRETIEALRGDGVAIAFVKSRGEGELEYGGFCVWLSVVMEDGSCYDLCVPCQTEKLFSLNYWQRADDPQRNVS